MRNRRADRIHAVFMVIAAIGTIAYWVVYFTSGATHVRTDEAYLAFENAFPLADGWMTVCFLIAAFFHWRGDPRGVLWGLCAGSAMVFLGCIDLLFNIEQDTFAHLGPAMWAEIVIVAFCLIFGPFTIHRMWRHPLRRAG